MGAEGGGGERREWREAEGSGGTGRVKGKRFAIPAEATGEVSRMTVNSYNAGSIGTAFYEFTFISATCCLKVYEL